MSEKVFSMAAFLGDLMPLVGPAELSWDFKISYRHRAFMIMIPINFFSRREEVERQVRSLAEKHGLKVSDYLIKTECHLMLWVDVKDLQGEPIV